VTRRPGPLRGLQGMMEAASPPLIFRARRAGYGAAPPASRVLRIALRATALRAALDAGDLGGPCGQEARSGQGLPPPDARRANPRGAVRCRQASRGAQRGEGVGGFGEDGGAVGIGAGRGKLAGRGEPQSLAGHEAFSPSRASSPSKIFRRPVWPLPTASSRWRWRVGRNSMVVWKKVHDSQMDSKWQSRPTGRAQ